jgi:translation initiation factor 2 alpha subunit (eIF-2alpha)
VETAFGLNHLKQKVLLPLEEGKNMISKLIQVNGNWKTISLEHSEIEETMDNLLQRNYMEVVRVLTFFEKMKLKKNKWKKTMINSLLEKQLIASYPTLQNALEEKIAKMKSTKALPKPEPPIQSMVEDVIQKKTADDTDEYFELPDKS